MGGGRSSRLRSLRMTLKNRSVIRNIVRLMSIFMVMIVVAISIVYAYDASLIRSEALSANAAVAQGVVSELEAMLDHGRRIAGYLAIDEFVQAFFASAAPEIVYGSYYYQQVGQKVEAYRKGTSYINSIYVYSPRTRRVICDRPGEDGAYLVSAARLADDAWMERLSEENDGFQIYTRGVGERGFPFVLTLLYDRVLHGVRGVVVVNIDLQKLSRQLSTHIDAKAQRLFLVDERSRVVVERVKTALYADPNKDDVLARFDPLRGDDSEFIEHNGRFIAYAQVKSQEIGWYCVVIAEPGGYADRMLAVRNMALLIALGLALLAGVASLLIYLYRYKPLKSISDLLDAPQRWIDREQIDDEGVQSISDRIIANIQANQSLRAELSRQLELLDETRIQTLQLQISPHFLFNTLNLIGMTISDALGDEHPSAQMVYDLAQLLRYSLEAAELAPIREELGYTGIYLQILRRRYDDSFQTELAFDEACLDAGIPKLLLQPLIENAVFHGRIYAAPDGRGMLRIQGDLVRREGRAFVRIATRDNGQGIDPETLSALHRRIANLKELAGENIGVQNIAKRLYLLYHEQCAFEIESELGRGSTFTLTFPYLECKQ